MSGKIARPVGLDGILFGCIGEINMNSKDRQNLFVM